MCLIIHKPAGKLIAQSIIESAMKYNADGAGIMLPGNIWRDVQPDTATLHAMINTDYADKEIAVHFRMCTHGAVNIDNTHPFELRNGGYLMHNGILSQYAKSVTKNGKSDTALFVDRFCNPLISKFGSIPKATLEKEIGGNAIAIMHPDGKICRYGVGWREFEGSWYSNGYAWDNPNDPPKARIIGAYDFDWRNWRDGAVSKYGTPSVITGEYSDAELESSLSRAKPSKSIDYYADELADRIQESLVIYADCLPLDTNKLLSADDDDVYAMYADGQLNAEDLLACISPDSTLALYNWLVRGNYVV